MVNRRKAGISPVVATVILVAVAIVIAIAVAFWASGLVGIFTRFEKLEIISAYQNPANPNEFIVLVRNTGSQPTQLIQVSVNAVPSQTLNDPIFAFGVGVRRQCTITVGNTPIVGTPVEITLHSSGGKTYPTAVLANLGQTAGTDPWTPGTVTVACIASS